MSSRFQYITLVTSLPHLGKIFSQAEVPLSEYRLKQRIKMLTPEHTGLLERLVEVSSWAGVAKYEQDGEVIRLARDVMDELADHPDLQHLVRGRMEARTIIAALRMRHGGAENAGDINTWGFGRWCNQIKENWTDPGFGLAHFMPWIVEAHALLAADDHIGMERLALSEVFQQLDHYSEHHQFDFEAVAIYVLRWIIVERWSRYNADAARERLSALVEAALDPDKEPLQPMTTPFSKTSDLQQESRP